MSPDLLHAVAGNAFFGAAAAAGFAVLFNVPKRTLLGSALAGAVGIAVRDSLGALGFEIALATFFASLAVGLFALALYRYYKTPAAIFSVSGAIPMVPGVFAFKAMMGFIAIATGEPGVETLLECASNFAKTALVLIAIATGITAPSLLFKRFNMVM